MTLQQLRYIVAIDRYRHFGKAAESCGLTQSTLSLMVKKLEEELDVQVFDRDAYPVAPTEIGRKIIDQAKVALYNVEQISEITKTEKEAISGALRIALISTVAPVLIPGLFKSIGHNFPSISLQTEEMLTGTIKDKLRKAEVDMGIMAGPVTEPDFPSAARPYGLSVTACGNLPRKTSGRADSPTSASSKAAAWAPSSRL